MFFHSPTFSSLLYHSFGRNKLTIGFCTMQSEAILYDKIKYMTPNDKVSKDVIWYQTPIYDTKRCYIWYRIILYNAMWKKMIFDMEKYKLQNNMIQFFFIISLHWNSFSVVVTVWKCTQNTHQAVMTIKHITLFLLIQVPVNSTRFMV